MGARELSSIKPELDAHNVRMIGVGLEEFGADEFVKGDYWAGELYIDDKKQSYKDLGLKNLGYLAGVKSLFYKTVKENLKKAENQGIKGNLKGDGFQLAGTLVIDKGGKVLLDFRQDNFGDHVRPDDVLRVLNIPIPPKAEEASKEATGGCDEDVCTK